MEKKKEWISAPVSKKKKEPNNKKTKTQRKKTMSGMYASSQTRYTSQQHTTNIQMNYVNRANAINTANISNIIKEQRKRTELQTNQNSKLHKNKVMKKVKRVGKFVFKVLDALVPSKVPLFLPTDFSI